MIYNACTKPTATFQTVQVEQRGILSIKKTKTISSIEDIDDSPLYTGIQIGFSSRGNSHVDFVCQ